MLVHCAAAVADARSCERGRSSKEDGGVEIEGMTTVVLQRDSMCICCVVSEYV